ncbi:DUF2974 domain-containing protein [Nocardia jinanensis]|uniref:DUF2974 domain-containing protein n=1 Tax=Nocardia jinanensis TaxID=382504 RepID=A0A917RWR1_9NOCA|nr:DUF2974 domain-containing protein [Nocardia jinanensis]GGL40727.1 hypothetical protein GCM10011588_64360 [Nocardia jinanensis]
MTSPARRLAQLAGRNLAHAAQRAIRDTDGRMRTMVGTLRRGADEVENAARRGKKEIEGVSVIRRPDHRGGGADRRRSGGKTFAASTRSTAAQQIDRSLAKLADDVYLPARPGHRIDGFVRLESRELESVGIPPGALNDARSGLTSAIYRADDGRYVLAFAGTYRTSLRSWQTNFAQGMGLPARQYVMAGRLGKLARVAFGDDLVITGHSLGGGLATTAALKSGAPAVTFNGVGLSDQTIRGLGLEPVAARDYAAAGNVRAYMVAGDPLTAIQEAHRVHRSVIGGVAGGLVGSSLGGAVGTAIGGQTGRIAGVVAGRSVGGFVGAAMGGAAGATGIAGGLAKVAPALGARIDLPDPFPAEYGGGRLSRAIDLHELPGVQLALDQARPWSGPPGS